MYFSDEDVLDTWFSSALFPFSAMGWPDQTSDLEKYYPTDLLETGSDILFFWVARMVMLGKTLTGKIPFSEVLLHGILRDAHGRKMSKSLGNVINPMDVINGISLQDLHKQVEESNLDPAEIEKAKAGQREQFPEGIRECGTDALRFTLCSYNIKAHEISMDVGHVTSNRHFCNKIWQAFKFVQNHLGDEYKPEQQFKLSGEENLIDHWVLSRLCHVVGLCDESFRTYDLHQVARILQSFWIQDFCDVYLECAKSVFHGGDEKRIGCTQHILYSCLETYLRLISPFMPFISEELFQRLPPRGGDWPSSICVASYPKPAQFPWQNSDLEDEVELVKAISTRVLSVAQEYHLKRKDLTAMVKVPSNSLDRFSELSEYILALSRIGSLSAISEDEPVPEGCVSTAIAPAIELHVIVKGQIDSEKEIAKLQKKLTKLEKKIEKLQGRISGKGYSEGTPEDVKSAHKDLMLNLQVEQDRIVRAIETLTKL
ncbi:hypothetical protein ScPMuIL_010023 [Solemya velum]